MKKYRDIQDMNEIERAKLLAAVHKMIQLDEEAGLFDVDPAELVRFYVEQRKARDGR